MNHKIETGNEFILAFSEEMSKLGYTDNDEIKDGICWGKYMMIYTKRNCKSKNVVARIYIRENGIVLRLFLKQVSKHSDYILKTPEFIRTVFTSEYAKCGHCKGDICKFRKCYNLGGTEYEKCNGRTFEFYNPTLEQLPFYIDLFKEFFGKKRVQRSSC